MRGLELTGTSGLAIYAELALLLFFFAFLVVLTQVRRKPAAVQQWDEQSRLPLADDEDPASPPAPSHETGGN